MAKKNIVVVGAGVAGVEIARSLSAKLDSSKYNLILINSRPYHIFLIACARLTVSDRNHLEDTAFIPIGERLFHKGNGTFKVGTVKAIEKEGATGGQVLLESGEKLPYEILVLAPGSSWDGPLAFPNDPEQVSAFIHNTRVNFETSKHIVVAGAGAVGCEFAGEIKDIWPDKKVTIVHAEHQLLNKTYPSKARLAIQRSLADRGVEFVLGDYIDDFPEPGVVGVTTRNGRKIASEFVVVTRGPRPNTGFINSLDSDALTPSGYIKVKPTLQLVGHPDVLAAGDAIDWNEQKQAAKVPGHAGVVVENVLSLLNNRPLKTYKGSSELILITNGKNGGIAYFGVLWGIVFGGWFGAWFARLMKSRYLFIPKARASLGF